MAEEESSDLPRFSVRETERHKEGPCHCDRGKHRSEDAEREDKREAFHHSGPTHPIENECGDKR